MWSIFPECIIQVLSHINQILKLLMPPTGLVHLVDKFLIDFVNWMIYMLCKKMSLLYGSDIGNL